MTPVADLLQQSRTAHQQAKQALRTGQRDVARQHFRTALELRWSARQADPDRADAAWREDALHPAMPGETMRRYHREAGLTVDEVAAKKDAELERYYREQLGDPVNRVSVVAQPEIIIPKAWVLSQEGQPDICVRGHRMQLLGFDRRVCSGCQRVEVLRDCLPVEETMAFKQREKERTEPS